jgi:hypothetical protein
MRAAALDLEIAALEQEGEGGEAPGLDGAISEWLQEQTGGGLADDDSPLHVVPYDFGGPAPAPAASPALPRGRARPATAGGESSSGGRWGAAAVGPLGAESPGAESPGAPSVGARARPQSARPAAAESPHRARPASSARPQSAAGARGEPASGLQAARPVSALGLIRERRGAAGAAPPAGASSGASPAASPDGAGPPGGAFVARRKEAVARPRKRRGEVRAGTTPQSAHEELEVLGDSLR